MRDELDMNKKEGEENKGFTLLFFSFILKSFWIPEFTHMNSLLTKCAMISKNPVYDKRRRMNRIIQLPLTILPLLITLLTINMFLVSPKIIRNEIIKNVTIVKSAVLKSNHLFYKELKVSPKFTQYVAGGSVIIILNHLLFFIIGRALVRSNPILKESELVRKIFIAKGWSETKHKNFIKTRAGILCEIKNISPDVILKDKEFWRDIKTSPKPDYYEYEYNNHIILFESGIVLQKIEYKF